MVRRRLDRERYWRGMMQEQRTGGLSVSAFCRERGVSVTSFYKWRRKFAQQTKEQQAISGKTLSGELAARDGAMQDREDSNDPKFVPVELPLPFTAKDSACISTAEKRAAEKPNADQLASCEVVLPNGCRILVPMQCDASWLREILEVLKNRAC
jgi:transposase-like protein